MCVWAAVLVCLLTVRVEEGEHLSLSDAGPQQPGRDQALPLRLSHHMDDLQLTHILLQPALQVL